MNLVEELQSLDVNDVGRWPLPFRLAVIVLVFLLVFTACSSSQRERRPMFYPNQKYNRAGDQGIQSDVERCRAMADQYVDREDNREQVAKSTLKRSAVGSAVGATAGSFTGRAGRGAGIGASTGALLGLFGGLEKSNSSDGVYEQFVSRCLKDKGYEVLGWR